MLGRGVEGVGVLGVLAHRHLGEFGDHRVGRRSPDVGKRKCRLVGGDGQVLDRSGRLEELDVARAGGRGGRGQHADEGDTAGRAEDGGGPEARAKRPLVLLVEGDVRGSVLVLG